MEDFQQFLISLPFIEAFDEDENKLNVELNQSLSESEIAKICEDHQITLPKEYRIYLNHFYGGDLLGLNIENLLEGIINSEDDNYIAFHNWGNGDFDCLKITPNDFGTVAFLNHENGEMTQIAKDFSEWLQNAVLEIVEKGALEHPMDMPTYGMYKSIEY